MDALTRGKDADTRREQERNERFVRASELLAHEDAAVCMAGVYALERLAGEDGAGYADTVVEVLAGFVRERTNRKDYSPRPQEGSEKWERPTEPIQAAVTALNKICKKQSKDFNIVIRVDLRRAQLARLEANDFFMEGWKLANTNLQHAELNRSNLQKTWLSGANLRNANFNNANTRRAWFDRTNLQHTNLSEANLQSAYMGNIENWNMKQFKQAIWPIGMPPILPGDLSANQFDKTMYTDDKSLKQLHPELLDIKGEYKGIPYAFRERINEALAERRKMKPKNPAKDK
ncbi:MAG: pentapeptide repeat-containing protein [Alphaproteobacteria bacterium]|nr:pentapeptide repeat-containing protein [Alphaproteobacteria bacterium]